MKLNIAAAATLCTVFVSPVLAEEVVMYRPIQAGSLHEGPLDMVAYWTHLEDQRYEVTATFIARTDGAAPMRVVVHLLDGNDVSFAIPGPQTALYRFARRDGEVTASVELLQNVTVLELLAGTIPSSAAD